MNNFVSNLGFRTRKSINDIGYAVRIFLSLIRVLPSVLKRPRLITDQIFFIGNKEICRYKGYDCSDQHRWNPLCHISCHFDSWLSDTSNQ